MSNMINTIEERPDCTNEELDTVRVEWRVATMGVNQSFILVAAEKFSVENGLCVFYSDDEIVAFFPLSSLQSVENVSKVGQVFGTRFIDGLSVRAKKAIKNALRRKGYDSCETMPARQIQSILSLKSLEAMRNVGRTTLVEIQREFSRAGFPLS